MIFPKHLNKMIEIEEINKRFNENLLKQIEGSLPKYYTYKLGMPSVILQSVRIPDLAIELRASRLSDKAMQETHPFDLWEIMDLPVAVQNPLAIFRSATHLGHYVIMTELNHKKEKFVVVLNNRILEINSIRSIYPKSNNHLINWIDDGLLEYVDKLKTVEWISKQQSNSADVRKQLNRAAKIIQNFENAKFEDKY